MKTTDFNDLIGKTITGVIVKETRYSQHQIFLIFPNQTHCEINIDLEVRSYGIRDGGKRWIREYQATGTRILADAQIGPEHPTLFDDEE